MPEFDSETTNRLEALRFNEKTALAESDRAAEFFGQHPDDKEARDNADKAYDKYQQAVRERETFEQNI